MTAGWTILVRLWLQTAWRRRYLIFVILMLLPALGFAVGLFRSKVYQSSMTILVQEAAKHNPFLEDLAVETRLKDRIAALDALLHSRHVLLGVAVDLKWIDDSSEPKEREDVIRQLSESLRLKLIGDELVQLTYEQPRQAEIDRVLLAVAQRFMEKVLAPERSSIAGSVRFLEEQLKESAQALALAEEKLGTFMSKHADSLPDLHPGNVRRLAEMKLVLSEKRTALDGAKARYGSLISRLSQSNPVVSRIEMEIVSISAELAALRSRYTDAHSSVQAAERKLLRLRSERNSMLANAPKLSAQEVEEIWTAAAKTAAPEGGVQYLLVSQIEQLQEAKAEIIDLERQSKALDREVSDLDALVLNFGSMEKQLQRLRSNVEVKRDVHERLSERAEMARVTGALGQFEAPERVKVIDQPTIPTRPKGFPPAVFVVLGFFAAIGVGIGIIAFEEVTDTTLRTREQVTQLTGLPVITRIPKLDTVAPAPGTSDPGLLRRLTGKWKV